MVMKFTFGLIHHITLELLLNLHMGYLSTTTKWKVNLKDYSPKVVNHDTTDVRDSKNPKRLEFRVQPRREIIAKKSSCVTTWVFTLRK